MKINQHYDSLKSSYLFSTIAQKVQAFQKEQPQADLIKMGIGDVTRPLCPAVIEALHQAVEEMGRPDTFRGYGPEQGYEFLREAIAGYYEKRNVILALDEIFVGDGAKSDLGNLLDLLDQDNHVLIPDPVYPVYVDTNRMDGRQITFMKATADNDFLPLPEADLHADVIYLCSPNNPTGVVYDRQRLQRWVEYAQEREALILFDAAYEGFIQDQELPRSIYEIPGAKSCAIEVSSFSKRAGFTGLRCGYTVVPHELKCGQGKLNKMWLRRQTTKFNGVSYIVQRAAAAAFTPEGLAQTQADIQYYLENAALMRRTFEGLAMTCFGGAHSPYIWLACPAGLEAWDYFDHLLNDKHLVVTPGDGFGENGRGFVRLTAFGSLENTEKAMARIREDGKGK